MYFASCSLWFRRKRRRYHLRTPNRRCPSRRRSNKPRHNVDAGLAAQNGHDYDAAILFYSKAYELVPHPVLLFNIAQAHRLAGHVDQAVDAYRRFLATNPTGAEAQIARDLLDEIAKRKAKQARHVEQAIKARKDGQFEDARVELEAAFALDPQPDLLYELGQVYAKLGSCGQAITYYKRFKSSRGNLTVDGKASARRGTRRPGARNDDRGCAHRAPRSWRR